MMMQFMALVAAGTKYMKGIALVKGSIMGFRRVSKFGDELVVSVATGTAETVGGM